MAGWTSMRQYEPSSIPAESLKFELELYFFCPRFPLFHRVPISFLDDRRLWDERMSHFSTETLLDFARGLLASPKADEVNHHLEGCKKCRESYDKWRAVMEVGRREKKYRPSESAVQRAKEAFGLREVWRLFGQKAEARLIFDSFSQPLPKGVRSAMAVARQLQYRFGPLLIDIDLRKESHGLESPILLMGQILNADKPDQRVKDFRVLLLRGKRIAAQTNSSPLGEFRFELADAKNWKLLFEVEGQEVIPISLPELT